MPVGGANKTLYRLVVRTLVEAFQICMEIMEPTSSISVLCDLANPTTSDAWQDGGCPRETFHPSPRRRHAIEDLAGTRLTPFASDSESDFSLVRSGRLFVDTQDSYSPQTTQIGRNGQTISLGSLHNALTDIQDNLPLFSAP